MSGRRHRADSSAPAAAAAAEPPLEWWVSACAPSPRWAGVGWGEPPAVLAGLPVPAVKAAGGEGFVLCLPSLPASGFGSCRVCGVWGFCC